VTRITAREPMSSRGELSVSRIVDLGSIVLCALLPLFAIVVMFHDAIATEGVAFDLRVFYVAAEAALRGDTIYPPTDDATLLDGRAYVYPPLTAVAIAPLTMLPMEAAGLMVMVLLVVAACAIPLLLGVRDWRCVGMVLLWPPVISAIQTANVSIPLALAAALVWRYRDHVAKPGLALGVALAMKLVFWPLAIWLVVLRRYSAAVWAAVSSIALVLASWAVVAFDGFRDYPDLLRRLSDVMDDRGYSAYALLLDLGAPSTPARAVWMGVAVATLAGIVVVGRRGDARSSFILAIAASLAFTPVVWLHYFTLLLVVVALAQPRLGALWLVPLAFFVTPGSGDPTPFQTSVTFATAALTIVLAYRASVARFGAERTSDVVSRGGYVQPASAQSTPTTA
jgi:alpha-1,2-mannosyltransferase